MKGPYIIVCRAHSGGRVLAEAFIRNGIQMGEVHPQTKDTAYFAVRGNWIIRSLIEHCYDYDTSSALDQARSINLMKRCVYAYIQKEIRNTEQPFGWKFGETLFTVPVLLDAFAQAKVIHLIRDGRDVMLSRIPARFEQGIDQRFNKMIIFGNKNDHQFMNRPFNTATIDQYRNELEMLHWVSCIKFGLLCRRYSKQYLEVKYEDLCRDSDSVLVRIFGFIGVPPNESCLEWARATVNTNRINKWQVLDEQAMKLPMEIGGEMLKELDYI